MNVVEIDRLRRSAAAKETASRDWLRALKAVAPIGTDGERTLPRAIAEIAQARGGDAALISARGTLSFAALVERANRYARWAIDRDIAKGETVALLMPNRPDYFAIWLGLTSIGCVVALINTQLRGASLKHCIDVVRPQHIIVAAELTEQFRCAAVAADVAVWSHGGRDTRRIDRAIERFSAAPLSSLERGTVTLADRALVIFTSGTSGLPKAAGVSHRRLLQWCLWFAGLNDIGPADRMYNCLPMYHAIGGVVAIGALLLRGGSVVIGEKFSVREFWNDIVAWDCTLFQYIGELCRYLVSAPSHPWERKHRLRLACGNGLRGDIWERFQARFAIPRIVEFYAATEGNISLYNVEGRVGSVGRVPPFLAHRFPLALVKFDAETAAPARDANGRCMRCAIGETGEAIGRIGDNAGSAEFEGYSDAEETDRKILRDVFEDGDAWYRTGDLMRMDGAGFYYFVDRIGDTFRWKGENVACSEVTAVLLAFPGIVAATVYGVAVRGNEGKAGMAALATDGQLDLLALRNHLARHLPAYARPLFLRIKDRLDTTGTFKHQTADLTREGFDLTVVSDPLYVDDASQLAYVRLDAALYERIDAGLFRF